jgi:hypothetical protein
MRGGSLLLPLFSSDKKVAKKSLRLNFCHLKSNANLGPRRVTSAAKLLRRGSLYAAARFAAFTTRQKLGRLSGCAGSWLNLFRKNCQRYAVAQAEVRFARQMESMERPAPAALLRSKNRLNSSPKVLFFATFF